MFAAQQSAQFKAALMADATIDSTTIDVVTDADTMTIVLSGHVRSAAEKSRAGSIAPAKAPACRVQNNRQARKEETSRALLRVRTRGARSHAWAAR
jgi:osmotically-inducible protein OsmY